MVCLKQKRKQKLWNKAFLVAINKNEVKNYRPQSLLSVKGKVFERLIDDKHVLNGRQFIFIQGSLASDLILHLSSELRKSLDLGKTTVVVVIDISGAFDPV